MANHCSNYIEFNYNDKQAYKKFRKEFDSCCIDGFFDQEQFAKTFEFELPKDDYALGGRWFQVYSDEEGSISGDSAWSPMIGMVDKIAERYPQIDIWLEYSEPGFDFGGIYEIIDGEVTHQELSYSQYIIQYQPEQILNELEHTTEDCTVEEVKENEYFIALSEEEQTEFLKNFSE